MNINLSLKFTPFFIYIFSFIAVKKQKDKIVVKEFISNLLIAWMFSNL